MGDIIEFKPKSNKADAIRIVPLDGILYPTLDDPAWFGIVLLEQTGETEDTIKMAVKLLACYEDFELCEQACKLLGEMLVEGFDPLDNVDYVVEDFLLQEIVEGATNGFDG